MGNMLNKSSTKWTVSYQATIAEQKMGLFGKFLQLAQNLRNLHSEHFDKKERFVPEITVFHQYGTVTISIENAPVIFENVTDDNIGEIIELTAIFARFQIIINCNYSIVSVVGSSLAEQAVIQALTTRLHETFPVSNLQDKWNKTIDDIKQSNAEMIVEVDRRIEKFTINRILALEDTLKKINSILDDQKRSLPQIEVRQKDLLEKLDTKISSVQEGQRKAEVEINLTQTDLTKSKTSMEVLTKDLKSAKEELSSVKSNYQKNEVSIRTLVAETEQALKSMTETLRQHKSFENQRAEYYGTVRNKIDSATEEANKLKNRIDEIMGEAVATGLAGRFENEKQALQRYQQYWLVATAVVNVVLIGFSWYIALAMDLAFEKALLTKLLICLPLAVLDWFCIAQYSRLGRLADEYRFKSAIAFSLENYTKLIAGASDRLQVWLMRAISDLYIPPERSESRRPLIGKSLKDVSEVANSIAKSAKELKGE